jgi:predicted ATPase
VCARLDGTPLAIELAAARVPLLSVEQIRERLNNALGLLTTGGRLMAVRQQSLRATLDWSYGLLLETEQQLFQRLSVFAGGWALEAAEAVCAGYNIKHADVLDLLAGLVAKSLVVSERHEDEPFRYRLLEPIRQYAYEKLDEPGRAESIRQQHAEFLLTAEGWLTGPDNRVRWRTTS